MTYNKDNGLYTEKYNDKIIPKYNERPVSLFKTDVTTKDYSGSKLVSVRKHRSNMSILGARLDVLEKCFGIKVNPAQHLFLNDMIPLPLKATFINGVWSDPFPDLNDGQGYGSIDASNTTGFTHTKEDFFNVDGVPYKGFDRRVGWWCIGNGGENPVTPYVIHDVRDWETRLYKMVPYRFVLEGNDLSSAERAQYRLRKMVQVDGLTYIAYFAKVFNVGLVHSMQNTNNYLPGDVSNFPASIADSEPLYGDAENMATHPWNGKTSSIYIEFSFEVNELEFKEYYRATHNDQLTAARLSEFGLITGHDFQLNSQPYYELAFAELFAKLTHELIFLSSAESRRVITYKILT